MPVDGPAVFERVDALSTPGLTIERRYSRFGKLTVVNSGPHGRGFSICTWCGYAEKAPDRSPSPGRTPKAPAGAAPRTTHRHPLTGRECKGQLALRHLGHEFLTDVIEIRIQGASGLAGEEALWRSLVYALLEGASLALGIRRDDLDGTLYRYSPAEAPAIMLFDDVPGGAGHVRRIAEALPSVFQAVFERLQNDCCGPETSCYECLRNYRNQPYHGELKRGLARDFIARVLAEHEVPV